MSKEKSDKNKKIKLETSKTKVLFIAKIQSEITSNPCLSSTTANEFYAEHTEKLNKLKNKYGFDKGKLFTFSDKHGQQLTKNRIDYATAHISANYDIALKSMIIQSVKRLMLL